VAGLLISCEHPSPGFATDNDDERAVLSRHDEQATGLEKSARGSSRGALVVVVSAPMRADHAATAVRKSTHLRDLGSAEVQKRQAADLTSIRNSGSPRVTWAVGR